MAKKYVQSLNKKYFQGIFHCLVQQDYRFSITTVTQNQLLLPIVTLRSHIDEQLQHFTRQQSLQICGYWNPAGNWLLVEHVQE